MPRFSNDHYAIIGRKQTLDGTIESIIKTSGKLKNDQLSNEEKKDYSQNIRNLCDDAILLVDEIDMIEQRQNSVVEIGGN